MHPAMCPLTHWCGVMHVCVNNQAIICSDNLVLSHCMNQCWFIVNCTLANRLPWNSNQDTTTFIQENSFENVACEIVAILSRPQCVKCANFPTASGYTISHHICTPIFNRFSGHYVSLGSIQHIEEKTKWPPFRRRPFPIHFIQWNC